MNKITKATIKNIKQGYHDDLIEAIEFLIDTFEEDKFDSGYKARIQDESVVSYRLAEHISQKVPFVVVGKRTRAVVDVDVEDLAKVIESYYSQALKD